MAAVPNSVGELLAGKSTYYKAVLSALAKRGDKRAVEMFLKYAHPEHASIHSREGIIDMCIYPNDEPLIALRKVGHQVYLCLNDLSFGDVHLTKTQAFALLKQFFDVESQFRRELITLVWQHRISKNYYAIVFYWFISQQVVLKDDYALQPLQAIDYKDKFAYSRILEVVKHPIGQPQTSEGQTEGYDV